MDEQLTGSRNRLHRTAPVQSGSPDQASGNRWECTVAEAVVDDPDGTARAPMAAFPAEPGDVMDPAYDLVSVAVTANDPSFFWPRVAA